VWFYFGCGVLASENKNPVRENREICGMAKHVSTSFPRGRGSHLTERATWLAGGIVFHHQLTVARQRRTCTGFALSILIREVMHSAGIMKLSKLFYV
jgi:hypothetical protein